MTLPPSPLPWTIGRDNAIFDAKGVPVIADDGAIYPEDAALIVIAVNAHEQMRNYGELVEQQARDLAAARQELSEMKGFAKLTEAELNLAQENYLRARRECAEMRARTIEQIAIRFENSEEHWTNQEIADAVRALAKPEHKEGGDG